MNYLYRSAKHAGMLAAVLLLGAGCAIFFLTQSSAETPSQARTQLYLPLVLRNFANGAPQHAEASPFKAAEWPTYTSIKGGYTLRYPSDWGVNEGTKGSLVITEPSGKLPDKIWVGYLDFEKPETDGLHR